MNTSLLVVMAVFGLCLGSFLNVCIHRLPRGESLVSPGSRCPQCGRSLSWFDNIPVLSWVLLRGRCRQCDAPIAVRYPIIEIVTAVVWVVITLMTPWGWLLASRLVLGSALIVLFMIDLEHQLLPNVVTLPGIVTGFAFSWVAAPGPVDSLIGILVGGGVLYAIAAGYYVLRKEEGMGMGDVKMLAMVGAFLGWREVLLTLVLSSFAGAFIGLAVMAWQRENLRYALPFGTFIALAAFTVMLVGTPLLDWYLAFFPVSSP